MRSTRHKLGSVAAHLFDRMLGRELRRDAPAALEGLLSGFTFRALRKAERAMRSRRRIPVVGPAVEPWSGADSIVAPENLPSADQLRQRVRAVLLEGSGATGALALSSALARATSDGGYDTAHALARELVPYLATATPDARAQMLQHISAALRIVGEQTALTGLCERFGRSKGGTAVERSGLAQPYVLAQQIDAGKVDLDGLASQLLREPSRLVSNAELQLLLSNATLRSLGKVSLPAINRYLDHFDLPPVRAMSASDNLLSDLAFSTVPGQSRSGARVSVVMSAFNAQHTIAYAVRSILGQTHTNLELLVCDDASTDATLDVLRGLPEDPRLRLFSSRQNQGTYNVRNELIKRSTGEVITFHDADDLALPTRLAEQLTALDEPGIAGCVASWVRVRPDGAFVCFADGKMTRLSIVSFMVKRNILERIGPYRSARFGADLELYETARRLFGPGGVARVKKPLLFGLWSSSSLTRGVGAEALESGYRSPARRLYSELCFQQRTLGKQWVSDGYIDAELLRTGNFAEPRALDELFPRNRRS